MKTDVPHAIQTLRTVVSSGASWVLFEHGTCIFVQEAQVDLVGLAKGLLTQHGPVHAGSSSGDFGVIELPDELGWVVSYDFPDMLTLVLREEGQTVGQGDADVDTADSDTDVYIGLLGREKRTLDAEGLQVVHVENRHGEG